MNGLISWPFLQNVSSLMSERALKLEKRVHFGGLNGGSWKSVKLIRFYAYHWPDSEEHLYAFNCLFHIFFSIWVIFYDHSQITGLQGKREGIPLTPLYHFHPFQIHLNNSFVFYFTLNKIIHALTSRNKFSMTYYTQVFNSVNKSP